MRQKVFTVFNGSEAYRDQQYPPSDRTKFTSDFDNLIILIFCDQFIRHHRDMKAPRTGADSGFPSQSPQQEVRNAPSSNHGRQIICMTGPDRNASLAPVPEGMGAVKWPCREYVWGGTEGWRVSNRRQASCQGRYRRHQSSAAGGCRSSAWRIRQPRDQPHQGPAPASAPGRRQRVARGRTGSWAALRAPMPTPGRLAGGPAETRRTGALNTGWISGTVILGAAETGRARMTTLDQVGMTVALACWTY